MVRTAGTQSGGGSIHTISTWEPSTAADAPEPTDALVETLPFDRRWEPRARITGWAQVLCSTPYRTFLGGAKELHDISRRGIGLTSDCPMPEGEVVEIRLAPFKTRGQTGIIVRCDPMDEPGLEPTLEDSTQRYRIGIALHHGRFAA